MSRCLLCIYYEAVGWLRQNGWTVRAVFWHRGYCRVAVQGPEIVFGYLQKSARFPEALFLKLCIWEKNLPRHSDRRECGRLSSTDDRRQLIHFVYHDQRCALLGLDRLELRRLRADLILCYKIIQGLVLLSPDSFFTFVCNSRTRGHSFKLFLPDSSVDCRQHFFAVHLLRIWNSLPEDAVSAAHLSLFISHLVRVNLNPFLICKM